MMSEEGNGDNAMQEENPEALFDILTKRQLRDRYNRLDRDTSITDIFPEKADDFRHFVDEFPIDDAISECFALTAAEDLYKEKLKEYKSPLPTSSHENIMSYKNSPTVEEEMPHPIHVINPNVTPTKRSRLITSLFGKRINAKQAHLKSTMIKPNETKDKANLRSHHRPLSKADISSPENFVYVGGSNTLMENTVYTGGSNNNLENTVYVGESNNVLENTVYVGESNNLMENTVYDGGCNNRLPESTHIGEDPVSVPTKVNSFKNAAEIDNFIKLSPEMQRRDLQKAGSNISQMRDIDNNNVLHRSVIAGHASATATIVHYCPDLCSDLNNHNLTPIESAAKTGHCGCLNVLLDTATSIGHPGKPLIYRLVNISVIYGQEESLKLLLQRLGEADSLDPLPADEDGNTPAHVAALHGHLGCLMALVAFGYSVTKEDNQGFRPLQIAYRHNHSACFQYLSLVDTCGSLLENTYQVRDSQSRMISHKTGSEIGELQSELFTLQAQLQMVRSCIDQSRRELLKELESAFINNAHLDDVIYAGPQFSLDEILQKYQETCAMAPVKELSSIIQHLLSLTNGLLAHEGDVDMVDDEDRNFQIEDKEDLLATLLGVISTTSPLPKRSTHEIVCDRLSTIRARHCPRANACTDTSHESVKTAATSNSTNQHLPVIETQRDNHLSTSSHIHCSSPEQCDLEVCRANHSPPRLARARVSTSSSSETSGLTYTERTSDWSSKSSIASRSTESSNPGHRLMGQQHIRNGYTRVRLNLDNEDLAEDELRLERLKSHILSLNKKANSRGDFIEKIISASGEVIHVEPLSDDRWCETEMFQRSDAVHNETDDFTDTDDCKPSNGKPWHIYDPPWREDLWNPVYHAEDNNLIQNVGRIFTL